MSSSPAPSAPTPKGDDRKLVAVDENYLAPSFEDRLRTFWEKNSTIVTAIVAAVLIGIIAKEGWDYFTAQREQGVRAEFPAGDAPAALNTFIAAHPDHPLAGVALLRLADASYAAAKYAEAVGGYEKAAASLKTGPLASRARLGLAMAKLQSGRTADGVAALKALANDSAEPKPYRAEAAYQLARQAAAAGSATDLKTYADLVGSIDAASPWARHAIELRAAAPLTDAAPATK